jgi:hypothetical protein
LIVPHDPVLWLLLIALLAVLGLFLLDVFPYPFGFIILAVFIVMRLSAST